MGPSRSLLSDVGKSIVEQCVKGYNGVSKNHVESNTLFKLMLSNIIHQDFDFSLILWSGVLMNAWDVYFFFFFFLHPLDDLCIWADRKRQNVHDARPIQCEEHQQPRRARHHSAVYRVP